MGFCNCSMFCCAFLCVHSSFAIISIGKRGLVAFLCLSFWCLTVVVWPFLAMPRVCLQSVIVVFPYHIHLLIGSVTQELRSTRIFVFLYFFFLFFFWGGGGGGRVVL